MDFYSIMLGTLSETQQLHKQRLMYVLKKYLPSPVVEYCSELIIKYKLHLHIEIERKNKLGDYHPTLGKGNRISINHNLNPYDFLITFMHELAHHTTHMKFGSSVASHGKEWKEEFKVAMRPVVARKIFPPDIEIPLINHMKRPKYTHSGDVDLIRALMRYDKNKNFLLLEDIPEGSVFKMTARSKLKMIKGEKRKEYVECAAVDSSGKKYLVHPIAKVILIGSKT